MNHDLPAERRRMRRPVRWIGRQRQSQQATAVPDGFAALMTACIASLIGLVVLGSAIVFWLWGATYTLQGIDQALEWLARERNLPGVVSWWRQLGLYQWSIPLAFSCAELIWAPVRRFLPRAQGAVILIAAIFSAIDIFTTHLGLPIEQPWRLIGAIGLTFLPESAGLWAIQFIAEGWLHLWTTLRRVPERQ